MGPFLFSASVALNITIHHVEKQGGTEELAE